MISVTDVRVRRINQEGRMKAIVSVTLDDSFVVHDVKVVEGQSGMFVAMPSRKMPDGDYRDIAHPINSDARAVIQKHVLEAYDRALAEAEVEKEIEEAEKKEDEPSADEETNSSAETEEDEEKDEESEEPL